MGLERQGSVTIRDFDQGVVETLGAEILPELPIPDNQRYWLKLNGVDPPPWKPGVLVTFSFPESEFKSYVVPLVLIRRDDISPAMERWASVGHIAYRAPAKSANLVQLPPTLPANLANAEGYDKIEERQVAMPYDISYTISIMAHYRGALGNRGMVNQIMQHVLRRFPPYGRVFVRDDLGDIREYEAFMEGTSVLDEHPEVAERIIGFGVTIRVEAALDLSEPRTVKTVTQPLTLRTKPL